MTIWLKQIEEAKELLRELIAALREHTEELRKQRSER